MYKTILGTLLILLCSNGCDSIAIKSTDDRLQIVHNDKVLLQEKGDLVYKQRINLNHINIYQSVYKMKTTVVVYEDINVASGYRFSKSMKHIVHAVFHKYNYKFISRSGNSYFFILSYSDKDKNIYLMVENLNKKTLHFLYSDNKKGFLKILHHLEIDITDISIYQKDIAFMDDKDDDESLQKYIVSDWNTKNIILDALVSRVGNGLKGLK